MYKDGTGIYFRKVKAKEAVEVAEYIGLSEAANTSINAVKAR